MLSGITEFRLTASCGLAAAVLGFITTFFYTPLPGPLPSGFHSAIIALEFAPSFSYAASMFLDDFEQVLSYDIGHRIDLLFLAAYGLFLLLANLGAWQLQRRAINLIGILAAGVAASADIAENLQLMQLTQALLGVGGAPDFWLLRLYASTKFIMICISMLCLIPLLKNSGWLGRLFVTASALAAPLTVATIFGFFQFSSPMILMITLAWVCLLGWAVKARNGVHTDDIATKTLETQTL